MELKHRLAGRDLELAENQLCRRLFGLFPAHHRLQLFRCPIVEGIFSAQGPHSLGFAISAAYGGRATQRGFQGFQKFRFCSLPLRVCQALGGQQGCVVFALRSHGTCYGRWKANSTFPQRGP